MPQLLGAFWTVFRRVAGALGRPNEHAPELIVSRHRDILTALRAHDVGTVIRNLEPTRERRAP